LESKKNEHSTAQQRYSVPSVVESVAGAPACNTEEVNPAIERLPLAGYDCASQTASQQMKDEISRILRSSSAIDELPWQQEPLPILSPPHKREGEYDPLDVKASPDVMELALDTAEVCTQHQPAHAGHKLSTDQRSKIEALLAETNELLQSSMTSMTEVVAASDQSVSKKLELPEACKMDELITHHPCETSSNLEPQQSDMFALEKLDASMITPALNDPISPAGRSLQEPLAQSWSPHAGMSEIQVGKLVMHAEKQEDTRVASKTVRTFATESSRPLDCADAALQDALEQAKCSEDASDMNHISEVLANRREILQKLKEKRASRSRRVDVESDDLVEDDHGSINQDKNCDGAKKHRASLQQRHKSRKMQEDEQVDETLVKTRNHISKVSGSERVPDEVPRAEHRYGTTNFNEIDSSVEMSYADFQQAQRHSAATNSHVPDVSSTSGPVTAVEPPSRSNDFLQHSKKPDLHAARLKRIRELQGARGANPMPDVSVDKLSNLHSSDDRTKGKGEPLLRDTIPVEPQTMEADEHNEKLYYDEIIPSKKMSFASQGYSRSPSVIEPDPENQIESEPEVACQQNADPELLCGQIVPLKLSDVQAALHKAEDAKIHVPQEEVQDIINRFDKFCREPDDEPRKTKSGNMIFEELQGKWRELRGGMDKKDLRPEFRALLTPFDVRVDLGCSQEYYSLEHALKTPRSSKSPNRKVREDPLLATKEFPKLGGEIAAQRQRALPQERLGQANEAGLPLSPKTAGAVVSLPSLQLTEKARPTLNQLPKARQRENCSQQ